MKQNRHPHLLVAMFGFCVVLQTLPLSAADSPKLELSLRDAEGHNQSLSQYRGRIVVLNFWATWCGPCIQEMPMLAETQRKFADRGVVVIGVSLDDVSTLQRVRPFIKKLKIDFPIWVNGTSEDLKRFGLGEALPATAFFDAEGNEVGRVLGMLQKRDLMRRLGWMLGNDKTSPPPALVNNLKSR